MKANIPALGLAAAGLAACGGGLLAVLQIVTPLGGQWSSAGFTTTIQFTNLQPATQVFLSRFDVTATIDSDDGVCGATPGNPVDVLGTLDNGSVVLRPVAPANAPNCVQGSFSDLRKLDTLVNHASLIKVPWLLVHGTEDDVVFPQDSLDIFAQANQPVSLLQIKGSNHVFAGAHTAQMTEPVTAWVKARLG